MASSKRTIQFLTGDRPVNLFGGLFDRLASFSVGLGCGLGAGWYFSHVELKNSTESIISTL